MRTATVLCFGHPAIRASHQKTLEFSTDTRIGPRATCVVGVGATADQTELLRLRGRVLVTLSCGPYGDSLSARVNPAFERGGPLIVRSHSSVVRNAFLIAASKAASELNRGLIEAASQPGNTVLAEIEERLSDEPQPGALIVRPRSTWALGPAAEAASSSALGVERVVASPAGGGGRAAEEGFRIVREDLELGARVAVAVDLNRDLSWFQDVSARALSAGHLLLPPRGQPPLATALLAAGLPQGRLIACADGAAGGDPSRSGWWRRSGGDAVVAWAGRRERAQRVLRAARRRRPQARLWLASDLAGPQQAFTRIDPGDDLPRIGSGARGPAAVIVETTTERRDPETAHPVVATD